MMNNDAHAAGQGGSQPELQIPVQETQTEEEQGRCEPAGAGQENEPDQVRRDDADAPGAQHDIGEDDDGAYDDEGGCAYDEQGDAEESEDIKTPPAALQRTAPQDQVAIPDDETQRRHASGRLCDQLDLMVDLAENCGRLAEGPIKGRIEAIYAAARLAQANAQLARSLTPLLKVERRQLTIVHHVQAPAPLIRHSNSNGQAQPDEDVPLIQELLSKFFRYMKLYADEELGPVLERTARKQKEDAREETDSAATAETAEEAA